MLREGGAKNPFEENYSFLSGPVLSEAWECRTSQGFYQKLADQYAEGLGVDRVKQALEDIEAWAVSAVLIIMKGVILCLRAHKRF